MPPGTQSSCRTLYVQPKGCFQTWDIIKGELAIRCSAWGWPTRIESPFVGSSSKDINAVDESNRLLVQGVVLTTITKVLDWTDELHTHARTKLMERGRNIPLYAGPVARRRVFRTRDGHEGLVQDVVREGDLVVLLIGAYAPCVLRTIPKRITQEFHVVGTCVLFDVPDVRLAKLIKQGTQIGLVRDMKLI